MTDFAFPSQDFPALPGLRVVAGDAWAPVIVAGPLLTLVRSVESGRFAPNVTASVTRFPAGYDFSTAVDALDQQLSALPDADVTVRDKGQLQGRDAYVQEVVFTEPEIGTLVQIDLVVLVDRGAAVDLVHVAGTAAADRLDTEYADVREIVQSLVVTV